MQESLLTSHCIPYSSTGFQEGLPSNLLTSQHNVIYKVHIQELCDQVKKEKKLPVHNCSGVHVDHGPHELYSPECES